MSSNTIATNKPLRLAECGALLVSGLLLLIGATSPVFQRSLFRTLSRLRHSCMPFERSTQSD